VLAVLAGDCFFVTRAAIGANRCEPARGRRVADLPLSGWRMVR
jgi:hypothetical protein